MWTCNWHAAPNGLQYCNNCNSASRSASSHGDNLGFNFNLYKSSAIALARSRKVVCKAGVGTYIIGSADRDVAADEFSKVTSKISFCQQLSFPPEVIPNVTPTQETLPQIDDELAELLRARADMKRQSQDKDILGNILTSFPDPVTHPQIMYITDLASEQLILGTFFHNWKLHKKDANGITRPAPRG